MSERKKKKEKKLLDQFTHVSFRDTYKHTEILSSKADNKGNS